MGVCQNAPGSVARSAARDVRAAGRGVPGSGGARRGRPPMGAGITPISYGIERMQATSARCAPRFARSPPRGAVDVEGLGRRGDAWAQACVPARHGPPVLTRMDRIRSAHRGCRRVNARSGAAKGAGCAARPTTRCGSCPGEAAPRSAPRWPRPRAAPRRPHPDLDRALPPSRGPSASPTCPFLRRTSSARCRST
jgi:hypothetical protein